MNANKRKRLDAIIVLVEGLRDEEEQDLKDTPDNIEKSGVVAEQFNRNINHLNRALDNLRSAQ